MKRCPPSFIVSDIQIKMAMHEPNSRVKESKMLLLPKSSENTRKIVKNRVGAGERID
jgi:hypothetical protein